MRAQSAAGLRTSGSADQNAGDTLASFTFDFGDGTPPVTQGGATASHTYAAAGTYLATVRVTDDNGCAWLSPSPPG